MTAPVAIALVGAAGRMGKEIIKAAAGRQDVVIVAAVERSGSPNLGADIGQLCGLPPSGVTITEDVLAAFHQARIAIELSSPSVTARACRCAADAGIGYVCGTTGLGEVELSALDEASRLVPVLVASNLSPGIAVLRSLLGQAIAALGPHYDVEIIESHHRGKVDAPSGTALELARCAVEALGGSSDLRHGRNGPVGPRSAHEVGMHAVRAGGVFGDHTVVIAGMEERLELTHRAQSRALFAQGALRAALFLHGKPKGRYTMGDVFGL
ncbi:MAG: 4-hydroxy-tetrahydrodipicolinate reductase [Myxococcota bacterium]|jgi:4-hydroxy-tetrahydrodipicolinate reductase|nr:4-hydroxy-tetrahydrodipicolinate reductase [Myxococcota bacterium]